MSKMIYDVEDKPTTGKLIIFAIQQVLAIMAATIAVPVLIGRPNYISAAILGSGLATIVYLLFTKKKSPVIISSSFAYIGALQMASNNYGFWGIIIGGLLSGLVYVVIAIIIRLVGTKWVDKLLPPIVIGPVVALIGLTLAGSAVANLIKADGYFYYESGIAVHPYNLISLLCGLIAFFIIIVCTVQNKHKGLRLIPFLIGIAVGYAVAAGFTLIGKLADVDYLKIIDFSPIVNNFKNIGVRSFVDAPKISLYEGIKEIKNDTVMVTGVGFVELLLAFVPVALVSFSEHIADHKNLGSIIGRDLINEEPGLSNTLLGDGIGSMVGTVFGICPNTTYGESVGCVAITKNASVRTIFVAALMCIGLAFITPITSLLQTIPSCVMGGICLALYGYIAASGFMMMKQCDLSINKNLFTLSVILISGIGGLTLQIPYKLNKLSDSLYTVAKYISIGNIAFALILGVITYIVCSKIEKNNKTEESENIGSDNIEE